jgi:hypothetical protein
MNKNRKYFDLPINHIRITPYWLLGFIEGEGSFFLLRNTITPKFSISLTKSQQPVLEKIIDYLFNQLNKYSQIKAHHTKLFNLSIEPSSRKENNTTAMVKLSIMQIDYLYNIFIPFLESLNVNSKKNLDFIDFKLISKLIFQARSEKTYLY